MPGVLESLKVLNVRSHSRSAPNILEFHRVLLEPRKDFVCKIFHLFSDEIGKNFVKKLGNHGVS